MKATKRPGQATKVELTVRERKILQEAWAILVFVGGNVSGEFANRIDTAGETVSEVSGMFEAGLGSVQS